MKSRSRGEVNLGEWCSCQNTDRGLCNSSCGPANSVTPLFALLLLLLLFQAILLLCSVSVSPYDSPHPSRSETQSIAAGFPLIRLTDAHKWSYCLCNDRLIGSFGCLFCYCPLIGALGVSTVYRLMRVTEELSR